MAGDLTGSEVAVEKTAREANDDQCLRRRITVSVLPERVDAADRRRQLVVGTVEVDGAGLSVVAGQDTEARALFDREGETSNQSDLPPTRSDNFGILAKPST